MNFYRLIILSCVVGGLTACNTTDTHYDYQPMNYSPELPSSYSEYPTLPATQASNAISQQTYVQPVSHRQVDWTWVNSQNPQGYTIEIADNEKASAVAGQLASAPKKEHMAQVKYSRNGQLYYKGLYGTYTNQEEARKALEALPDNLKQGASVKPWSNVQSVLGTN